MKKIYILLPVHNRKEITRSFINCLTSQTFKNYHLILIDDGSTDGTAEMVKEQVENLTILQGNGNWWWAGCLQRGIEWLQNNKNDQEDIILIINDDVEFDENFLETGLQLIKSNDKSLILAQHIDPKTGICHETGVDIDLRYLSFRIASSSATINCLSTRGLFLKKSYLKKIGGFYPNLLPHYWSDYEFTIRAKRKGFKLMTSPKLAISLKHPEQFSALNFGFLKDFTISNILSKKAIHPIYSSIFVLIASPIIWIPINIAKIWTRFIRLFLKT